MKSYRGSLPLPRDGTLPHTEREGEDPAVSRNENGELLSNVVGEHVGYDGLVGVDLAPVKNQGGSYVEMLARKKGDLVPAPVGMRVLLEWLADVSSRDERLLRAMHIGRYHDPEGEEVVVRSEPRTETLDDSQTLMGFSKEEIVGIAKQCPLCHRS